MKRVYTVTAYDVLIRPDDWNDPTTVQIGILEEGVPDEVLWDSWIDNRLYMTMTSQEFADLRIGDDLDEGTTVLSIDYEPIFYSCAYYEEEYENADI